MTKGQGRTTAPRPFSSGDHPYKLPLRAIALRYRIVIVRNMQICERNGRLPRSGRSPSGYKLEQSFEAASSRSDTKLQSAEWRVSFFAAASRAALDSSENVAPYGTEIDCYLCVVI